MTVLHRIFAGRASKSVLTECSRHQNKIQSHFTKCGRTSSLAEIHVWVHAERVNMIHHFGWRISFRKPGKRAKKVDEPFGWRFAGFWKRSHRHNDEGVRLWSRLLLKDPPFGERKRRLLTCSHVEFWYPTDISTRQMPSNTDHSSRVSIRWENFH